MSKKNRKTTKAPGNQPIRTWYSSEELRYMVRGAQLIKAKNMKDFVKFSALKLTDILIEQAMELAKKEAAKQNVAQQNEPQQGDTNEDTTIDTSATTVESNTDSDSIGTDEC